MDKIRSISALEVLDSRGQPTLAVTATLDNRLAGTAFVPAGASIGAREARELRDEDSKRYLGKGVLRAVANVNEIIAPRLKREAAGEQRRVDDLLREIDGTEDKSKLGSNAMLGVSLAVARAAALAQDMPLYRYLRGITGNMAQEGWVLPIPLMNMINGGRHARNNLDFQEFMIFPAGASSFADGLRCGVETYHTLGRMLEQRACVTATGDVGGFAPDLEQNEEAIQLILDAISSAGYQPGKEISIAVDAAASEFFADGEYALSKSDGTCLSSEAMTEFYGDLITDYPIVSIEDGLAEEDWEGWKVLTRALGKRVQLVGDDLFATHDDLLTRGVRDGGGNAILIKPNQIGTLSETLDVIKLASSAGYGVIISSRSGDTEDTFITDLAVATNAGQIKVGSACRAERTAKYNRLLMIGQELGPQACYGRAVFRLTDKRQELKSIS
jgi:enolase